MDSFRFLSKERALLAGLSSSLKVPSEQVPGRVEQLVTKLRDAEKELARVRAEQAQAAVSGLLDTATTIGSTLVVEGRVPPGSTPTDCVRSSPTCVAGSPTARP